MKIKMLTISASPDIDKNWHEGEVREVSEEEARYWVDRNIAIALEPFEKAVVAPKEKAVVAPKEKAVVTPPETGSWGKGAAK